MEGPADCDFWPSVGRVNHVEDDLFHFPGVICVVAEVDAEDGDCVARAFDGHVGEVATSARGGRDGVN